MCSSDDGRGACPVQNQQTEYYDPVGHPMEKPYQRGGEICYFSKAGVNIVTEDSQDVEESQEDEDEHGDFLAADDDVEEEDDDDDDNDDGDMTLRDNNKKRPADSPNKKEANNKSTSLYHSINMFVGTIFLFLTPPF